MLKKTILILTSLFALSFIGCKQEETEKGGIDMTIYENKEYIKVLAGKFDLSSFNSECWIKPFESDLKFVFESNNSVFGKQTYQCVVPKGKYIILKKELNKEGLPSTSVSAGLVNLFTLSSLNFDGYISYKYLKNDVFVGQTNGSSFPAHYKDYLNISLTFESPFLCYVVK